MSSDDALVDAPVDEGRKELPDRDQAAINEVIHAARLRTIELMGLYFDRVDDVAAPTGNPSSETPTEIGINPEWGTDDGILGCVFTFGAQFEGDAPPYRLIGRFRATYELEEDFTPDEHMMEQFTFWNSIYNVWPYWRELVSNVLGRTDLADFTVEFLKMPGGPPTATTD